jgi:hypothetical protein
LITELKTLRKGRGVSAGDIHRRVGPGLRAVCEVTEDDESTHVRRKVTARLESFAAALPHDLHIAVMAGFGLLPDVRHPRYEDRVAWVADYLGRLPRTARRRIDEGIRHVAELILESLTQTELPVSTDPWHTTDLRITVELDRVAPEVVEQRRIVSQLSGLAELDLAITLASVDGYSVVTVDNPRIDVIYGGSVANRHMESAERLGFSLVLPRSLNQGEVHSYALQYSFVSGDVLRPYLACVPRYPCDLFDLRVRFGTARPPTGLWLLNRAFQRDIADAESPGEELYVNSADDIQVRFRDLSSGLAYGVRWERASAADES